VSQLHFDVVGAEGPHQYFGSLRRDTLAHAFLFAGPAGVGKKTFARRLAQSLLCTAERGDLVLGYDGTCASCQLFHSESARHPDFLEHTGVLRIGDPDAALAFGSDELSARDLVRQLSMQSYSGGLRVLLLGDVDFATQHAANALLKFLEEPPASVVMILTSAAPGRLLSTIRSRLIEVRFSVLSNAQVKDVLERMHFGTDEAELGARLSGGSVARAVSALQEEGESLRAHVARWFFESVEGKTPPEGWATRETLEEGLETIKLLVRDWIAMAVTGDRAVVSVDYADRLKRLRPLPSQHAVAILTRIDEAQRLSRTNVSPTMVSELVRMAITNADGVGSTNNA
jgi:DNA polymerase-3 subunit delta'